ncbi:MAG: hypothetical protein PHQ98_03340 [Candidatus ainarchaeum sp.]|nr:hypothetical protein [Candidatus ainarchaeum sp.]
MNKNEKKVYNVILKLKKQGKEISDQNIIENTVDLNYLEINDIINNLKKNNDICVDQNSVRYIITSKKLKKKIKEHKNKTLNNLKKKIYPMNIVLISN